MFKLTVGEASDAGRRARNEDATGWHVPPEEECHTRGALLAVADGVAGCDDGRLASGSIVRGLLADYYAAPDTWEPALALQRVLQALNRWLLGQASRQSQTLVTTLSALVLRGRRYAIAHVGDTRIYRLRAGCLERITRDHVWEQAGMQHVLTRAIGLDASLALDYYEGELEEGDVWLLLSDGVWEPLGDRRLHEVVHLHQDPAFCAQALLAAAAEAGSQDNMSALVARIDALPAADLPTQLAAAVTWPVPPRLRAGQQLDGFQVEELLHESRASLVYRVRHRQTGVQWVLKTLHHLLAEDTVARAGLLTEEWLLKRLLNPAFPQAMVLGPAERNWLYYVMSWHSGCNLEQLRAAGHRFAVTEIVDLGRRLAQGVACMHRLNILHRDIKPDNLHLGDDGRLRILDLGIAACEGLTAGEGRAGTPSYMAPELFAGAPHAWTTDLYALGVTLYRLLTDHYPYGEIEPFQTPRFGDPLPASRYRTDVPHWLDQLLLKLVARDPQQRVGTADELLLALDKGELDPVRVRVRSPLAERYPGQVWLVVALLSLALNVLLLYVIAASR